MNQSILLIRLLQKKLRHKFILLILQIFFSSEERFIENVSGQLLQQKWLS